MLCFKKRLKVVFALILMLLVNSILLKPVFAVYDPLSKPNNFYGTHILFPEELEDAARLVNSSGGDWGYVTIPIRADEKDLEKWQKFMDDAKSLHIIPILRIATEGDYFRKEAWRKPDFYDIVDFANFLGSLSWPTKNRYVILFNEINRFDEWGGEKPDPSFYSQIVDFAYKEFKKKNEDFFIILGGFDNASITDGKKYVNVFDYLNQLVYYDKDIFNKIDGISSHSYPNPAFSMPPSADKRMGTSTYKYEYELINSKASVKKPVFITETGWDSRALSDEVVASYYKKSFDIIWKEDSDKIVAITPFLLKSHNGPFDTFSFFKDGKPTSYHENILSLSKIKGSPLLNPASVLGMRVNKVSNPKTIKFEAGKSIQENYKMSPYLSLYLRAIFGLM